MFLGQKNIKTVLEILSEGRPPTFSITRKIKLFILTAVARKLVVGFGNKLADDLEHVLGLIKYGKLGRDAARR